MKLRVAAFALMVLAGTLSARTAQAAPVLGAQLIATGGDVMATFLGHTAGYTNDLYLFDASDLNTPLAVTAVAGPGFGGATGLIFTNHTTAPGTTINLGSFAAGTELVFGIHVRNTGDNFYMGAASRNVDKIFHAAVDNGLAPPFPGYGTIPVGSVGVGFEDLLGGGDLDYDDLGFAFSNVRSSTVPEPATLLLVGLGFAGAAARRRARR
jgi:hypothetical protein